MISVNQSSHWEAWASLEHWCSEQRHGRAPVKEKEKKKEEKIKKIYTDNYTFYFQADLLTSGSCRWQIQR